MDIGIDFDGTYAADPAAWAQVVRVLQAAGHKVVLVTNRTSGTWGEEVRRLVGMTMPIIYAGDRGESKYQAARRNGFKIQVWIDDNPGTIGGSHVLERTQWMNT